MRERAVKTEAPREGWPWFAVQYGERRYALKMRGGPRERASLGEWADEVRKRARDAALAAAEAAKADDADADAVVSMAREAHRAAGEASEGTIGFLVAWAWADPDVELVARSDYDAGTFAGPHDAKLACGLAAVEELLADGWEWEAIEDLGRGVYRLLNTGTVSRREVVDLVPFSLAHTEVPSTTS